MSGTLPSASSWPRRDPNDAPFPLVEYLRRIDLPIAATSARAATRDLLSDVTAAHSRAIPFENLDVVLRRPIDMSIAAVERKLIQRQRGGYCFELNTLLGAALSSLGFFVEPLLCRVRWNKPEGVETPFTHLALRVRTVDGSFFLADVGFAGTNPISPLEFGVEEKLLEGVFRTAPGAAALCGYTVLQWCLRGAWRDLYAFRTGEVASDADLLVSNFWSCASPMARFTTSFFVQRVVGDERHHILNDAYVIRRGHDGESATVEERVHDTARLCDLLASVFGIDAPEGVVSVWCERYKRGE